MGERGPPYARPHMRGRYLIRNRAVASAAGLLDGALALAKAAAPPIPQDPERILVCNWAHMGDLLLTLPAIRWLRTRYPKARVDVLAGSWSRTVARESGLIDEIITVDHWKLNRMTLTSGEKLRRYLTGSADAVARIRENDYALAIDFYQHFPTAAIELRRAGVPVRIGYTSGGLSPLFTHAAPWTNDHRFVTAHHADLLNFLTTPDELRPELSPFYPLPSASGLPPLPDGFVLVQSGTGAPYREWPDENWRVLVKTLEAANLPVVLAGVGAREEARAAALAAESSAINLAGRLDWAGFVHVVSRAKLLLCLESVAAHLGAAFGIPTVAIWSGTTDPAEWGPMNERATLISGEVPCAPCFRPGCDTMDCIRRVSPEQVWDAAQALLAPRKETRAQGLSVNR